MARNASGSQMDSAVATSSARPYNYPTSRKGSAPTTAWAKEKGTDARKGPAPKTKGQGKGAKGKERRADAPSYTAFPSMISPPTPAPLPNFLDPMSPIPAPAVVSDGRALPHSSLVSADFMVKDNHVVLFCTNTGDSGTVAMLFEIDATGAYAPEKGLQLFTIPTLATADTAGGPSATRAMKMSVSITNCSNALKRGGRVTYLNSSQRLPAEDAFGGTYNSIVDGIKSSPYRRRITGDMLAHPMQLITYPVDNTAYLEFKPHKGTLTASEFKRYTFGAAEGNSPLPRPMSVVAWIFDPAADQQDYSITIRASYYTRWPLTSVPGQSMRSIPTASAHVINHVREHAETRANDLEHVVEGGVAATVAPRAAGAVRNTAGSILSRITGGVEEAGSAMGDAAEAAGSAIETVAVGAIEEAPLIALSAAAPTRQLARPRYGAQPKYITLRG